MSHPCPQPEIRTPYPAICPFCIWLHPTLPNFSFSLFFYLLPTSASWPIASLSRWREQWLALHSDTSFLSPWYTNQLLWIALPNTVLFPWNAFPSSISKIYLSFKAPFKHYHLQEVFPIHLHWKWSVIGGPFYTTYIVSCISILYIHILNIGNLIEGPCLIRLCIWLPLPHICTCPSIQ